MSDNERDGQTIYVDEWGKEYILDERGHKMPPMRSAIVKDSSSFLLYDDSQGHCALCGMLTCRGQCFK